MKYGAFVFAAIAATSVSLADGPPHKDAPRPAIVPNPVLPAVEGVVMPDGSIMDRSAGIAPIFVPKGGFQAPGFYPDEKKLPNPLNPRETDVKIFVPEPGMWGPMSEDQGDFGTRSRPLFQDFAGISPGELNPPDNDLAFGLDHVIAVINDDFAVYDRCGNELFSSDMNDYLGISTNYLIFDPKVIFDPWNNRWVQMWHKKRDATQEATMIFLISADSDPMGVDTGDYYYEFNFVQDDGTADESWNDYYDLGYSSNTINFAGNQFRWAGGFRWARLGFLDKTQIYSAASATITRYSNLTNVDGSTQFGLRAAKQQWSWSEGGEPVDAVFVQARSGGGNRVDLRKLKSALTAPNFDRSEMAVGAYVVPPNSTEPNGNQLDTIDCRLMTAVVTGDTLNGNGIELFTGHTVGTNGGADASAQLFKIDPVAESVEWETTFFSPGVDYSFPSVAADYSGSAVWVFSRCSSGEFMSVRYVDYNQGVWSNSSSLAQAGTGNNNGFRWGDYFGGQLDWGDYNANFSTAGQPGKMWVYGEYAISNSWRTHIAATSVFSQGDLSSVTPSTTWQITGPKGGPFSPTSRVYTLGHSGQTGIEYTITGEPTWINDLDGRDLYPGGTTRTPSLNTTVANGLNKGTYNGTITFADCFNGGLSYNRAVQLIVQQPDLDILSITAADGPFFPGETLTTQVQYRNNGDFATGSFTVDFYASANTTISTGDTYIGSRNYSSLGAGVTSSLFTHFLEAPCLDGLYYIGAIATVTNEFNTADNVAHDATRATFGLCPADFNQDCFVNGDDFDAFLEVFELGKPQADYNGDGFVTGDDFDEFAADFEAGCKA